MVMASLAFYHDDGKKDEDTSELDNLVDRDLPELCLWHASCTELMALGLQAWIVIEGGFMYVVRIVSINSLTVPTATCLSKLKMNFLDPTTGTAGYRSERC